MLAVSCAAAGRITDVFGTIDRKAPEVVSYRLESSGLFTISYDEDVTIEEALIGGSSIDIRGSGRDFSLAFPVPLAMGHEYTLFIMAEDAYGNTLRTAFFLTGPNDDVPYTVINEIAPEAPDRVELLVIEDGNTAGMVLKDGTDGDFNGRFLLPDLEVKANDIILIYWNGKADEESREREDGSMTYVFEAGCSTGLTATNAPLILYKEEGGDIIDGVVYTTGDAETAGGYGNTRTAAAMMLLLEEGRWTGPPIPSADVTASRVLARRPGGYDTDSADDWFTTAARSSTLGDVNAYLPYDG